MRWFLLISFVPILAQAQAQQDPPIEPAVSAVVSLPFAPMWQLGAGVRCGDWSYEARYGWAEFIGPNIGGSTFHSFAIYGRNDVSDMFYWMVGAMYVSIKYTPPQSWPGFHSGLLYEHTMHSLTDAVGLGVGYKFIFLELQAYYPGLLAGIRVGIN